MNINDTDIFSKVSPAFSGTVRDLFANAAGEDGILQITNQDDMTYFGKTLTAAIRANNVTVEIIGDVRKFKLVG